MAGGLDFSGQARVVTDFSGQAKAVQSPGVMSLLGQFGSGVNERLAPLYQLAPLVPGYGAVKNVTDAAGLPSPADQMQQQFEQTRIGPEARTPGERIARRTGQEVGAVLPMALAPYLAAAAPAVAITAETGLATRAGQAFLNGIRNAPRAAAVGELAATTGAGVGAGVAREIAPGSQLAEIAGQLVGGLTPIVAANAPASLAARAGSAVVRRLSPAATRQAAQQEVRRIIGEPTAQTEAAIKEAQQLEREIPGFEPSLAEITGQPSLINTQRDIEARATGAELDALAARKAGSRAAVEAYAAQQAPGGPQGIEFAVDAANQRMTSLRAGVERQQAGVRAEQERLGEALPPADRVAIGERLREKMDDPIKGLERQARDAMKARATDLGLNDVGVELPFGAFQDRVRAIATPRTFQSGGRPEVVDKILNYKAAEGANEPAITFQDYQDIRTSITDELRDTLSGTAQDKSRRVAILVRLRKEVDGLLDDVIGSRGPLAENARIFRDEFRSNVIDRFERGVAYKVTQKNAQGFYRTADEEVASTFFVPGKVSAARQFKAVFGDDPAARADLATAALDSLRASAVRDGVVDPKLLETWTGRHASVLDEFPDIKAATSDIRNVAEGLAARNLELTERTREIEQAALTRELERVSRGAATPEQLLDRALQDPRKMRDLKRGIRDDYEADDGLKKSVWDRMTSLDDLPAYLERYGDSLKMALDPSHIDTLGKIARAREMLGRVPTPVGSPFRPDPTAQLARQLGQGIPQIGSRIFAVKSGRISARYMLVDMGGRLLRGRSLLQSEQLLKEALYDPQVARDYYQLSVTRVARPDVARRLNVRLFNLGAETSRQDRERTLGELGTAIDTTVGETANTIGSAINRAIRPPQIERQAPEFFRQRGDFR